MFALFFLSLSLASFAIADVEPTYDVASAAVTSTKPSLDKLIEKTLPAVVSLQVETDVMHDPSNPQNGQPGSMLPKRSAGSAFFISPNGLCVTNAHVVKDAKTILVTMQDGHETIAHVVGLDTTTDIAILKVGQRKCFLLVA